MSCHMSASQVLRSAGYRLTPQRLFILEAVYHLGSHVTAEQVLEYVQRTYPYVDLSTVYRALELFVSLGLIRRFSAAGRPNEYEVATVEPHHHLVCQGCGKVETVPAALLSEALEQVAKHYGFALETVHMALPGLCADCQAQDNEQEE